MRCGKYVFEYSTFNRNAFLNAHILRISSVSTLLYKQNDSALSRRGRYVGLHSILHLHHSKRRNFSRLGFAGDFFLMHAKVSSEGIISKIDRLAKNEDDHGYFFNDINVACHRLPVIFIQNTSVTLGADEMGFSALRL